MPGKLSGPRLPILASIMMALFRQGGGGHQFRSLFIEVLQIEVDGEVDVVTQSDLFVEAGWGRRRVERVQPLGAHILPIGEP